MSAREPAIAGAARNGYITTKAGMNLEMTAIPKLSDQSLAHWYLETKGAAHIYIAKRLTGVSALQQAPKLC